MPKEKKELTKTALIQTITDKLGGMGSPKQVEAILDALTDVAQKELEENGVFVLPGFAKFSVVDLQTEISRSPLLGFRSKRRPRILDVRVMEITCC